MQESLGTCCWRGGRQRKPVPFGSILCYSRLNVLQNLTFSVSRTNMGFFSLEFLFVFYKHLQVFSIWMLWILFFALCHNLKWVDVCFHLLPHLFLLLSSTHGHTSLNTTAPTAISLSSLPTINFRLSVSLPKFEKISVHHHLPTLLNLLLYSLCQYSYIWLDIGCFLQNYCSKKFSASYQFHLFHSLQLPERRL